MRLPSVDAGEHTVLAEAPAELFLSNVAAPPGAPRFVRRLTFRAPGRFRIGWSHDGSSSLVNGRLFRPAPGTSGCRVTATLDTGLRSLALTQSLSYERRAWTFGPGEGRVAALAGDTLELERSAPFFISLGDDVATGPVAMQLEVDCPGDDTFMTLTRLLDADASATAIFRER